MTKKVCQFFEILGKNTKFDRGDEHFRAYILSNLKKKRVSYPRFMSNFKEVWENFIKDKVGINVSQFFIENGKAFMKEWYTDVFTFPKSRIHFNFGQGGSQVDVLITIKYLLSEIELNCLEEIIKKYTIEEKTVMAAALISMLEPCVILGHVISEVMGQEFRVSIEDREIEGNQIVLELSARPK